MEKWKPKMHIDRHTEEILELEQELAEQKEETKRMWDMGVAKDRELMTLKQLMGEFCHHADHYCAESAYIHYMYRLRAVNDEQAIKEDE